MFVVIYEPNTNVMLLSRRMGPNEKMDADKFADMIAAEYDREIDWRPMGYIPDCSGDIRVEFRPQRDAAWHIWSGQSYYFKQED